ncbi:MAG: rRNA maturation RNase YbeY [Gammaproteobacteria bacterium]|jgi:probable rRNA maturation factor
MGLTVVRQVAGGVSGVPDSRLLSRWAEAATARAGREAESRELTVRIVDEAESRELNRHWRGKDRPTNVLAFPGAPVGEGPAASEFPLGDLVVCAPVVVREAAEQGKTTASHWCHMVVHGTLHLLGYDHQTASEAARMEDLEAAVLADLGFPDPYGDR